MNVEERKDDLQKLITRLQDAEKGFIEIAKASSTLEIKDMANLYSKERRNMRLILENHLSDMGDEPKNKTSFISSVHRAWIDFKLNAWGDDFVSVVDEIERGATVLIQDYQKTIDKVQMNSVLYLDLVNQQEQLILELEALRNYRENILESA